MTSPNGFHWQTTPDSSGYAFAEFIANPDSYQGHLYINPEVKSTIPPSGGSTGTLIQLVNGDPLTITVNYTTGGTSPQSYSEQQIIIPESTSNTYHITSATDPVSEPSAPTYNNNSITVTDDNQDETFPEWAEGQNGFVHLVVSFPASLDLSNWAVDFTTTPYYGTELPLIFSLSDDARNEWDSMRVTNFYNHLYAFYNSEEPNQASLYFAPDRDEYAANGYSPTSMTLQVQLPNNPTVFVSSVSVTQDWNLSDLTPVTSTHAAPPDVTTGAGLQTDLNSTSPEYDVIDLEPGALIVSNNPIEITHTVTIVGNGATIEFQQDGNTWPYNSTPATDADGAFYVNEDQSANIHANLQITFEDFTIEFANNNGNPNANPPVQWGNGDGGLFDPNADYAPFAVINDQTQNENYDSDMITLSEMNIYGPPAFDENSPTEKYATLHQDNSTYVGEPSIPLLLTNAPDFGSITDCTLQGGTVELNGGPWVVQDNTLLGAMAGTYSLGAISANSGEHDILVQGNHVTQSASTGYLLRFVNFGADATDTTVEDNTVSGGNLGYLNSNMDGWSPSNGYSAIHGGPEFILQEPQYSVWYEGRPASVSANGYLLVLSNVISDPQTFGQSTGPTGQGDIVSIVGGVNADGSTNLADAGQWFVVAQQVSDADGTLTLLMQDPLPPLPSSGYYVVELTDGFVNNSYIDNYIDTGDSASVDMDLAAAEAFGTRVIGNTFIGGGWVCRQPVRHRD